MVKYYFNFKHLYNHFIGCEFQRIQMEVIFKFKLAFINIGNYVLVIDIKKEIVNAYLLKEFRFVLNEGSKF